MIIREVQELQFSPMFTNVVPLGHLSFLPSKGTFLTVSIIEEEEE